jgi:acyl-ACP thioesterase
MEGMYTEKRRITYYDLDCKRQLKLSAFLRMVHIGADINAKDLGIGFTDLTRLDMGFVLQRFGLRIHRMPLYDEIVDIRTWPAAIERGTFIRKGDMPDQQGNKLMEWTSMWVLFDTKARKILRPSALPVAIAGLGDVGVQTTADKIDLSAPLGESVSSYTHTVRYCDVDTNMHMNNCIYGDLIDNALSAKRETAPDGVQINYLAETRLGEQIDITCHQAHDTYTVVGKSGDKLVFSASVSHPAAANSGLAPVDARHR